MMHNIHDLLEYAISRRASDVILKAGSPPVLRIDGRVVVSDLPPLTPLDCHELAYSILYSAARDALLASAHPQGSVEPLDVDEKMQQLEAHAEIDTVFTIGGMARVRCNLFLQRGSISAALRIIPLQPPTIEEANLPTVFKEFVAQPQGLILITGPTGSGKSTTMAAMIEEINRTRTANIVTIEEPIEYVFEDKQSVILQREVGSDTTSFATALRSVLRQNPDVIAIGEMRDVETMRVALTAAELGHLVIATLHTMSAPSTITRILNSFPPEERVPLRVQLANTLICAVAQRLVLRADGQGRLPAVEILVGSPTVRKLIEDGKTDDLYAAMREGEHYSMNTLNQALERLYTAQLITYEEALAHAGNVAELKQMLRHK
ncbi:MAG: PilT/PilU family type 4a pilus ATPase [Chthonomonadetes bacterium]|nr:PilT/PilU family type 4a pilus ATPase [Chthonomonadetes bacterium]